MSVTLRKKKNKKGLTSLYLDIYYKGNRHAEFLDLKLTKGNTLLDRQTDRETLALAKQIQVKRAQELISSNYQIITTDKDNVDFLKYLDGFTAAYTKKDLRNMTGVVGKFKLYLTAKKIKNLTAKQVNENLIHGFKEYLEDISKGEGAASYFARFKKILKQAVRDGLFLTNPAQELTIQKGNSEVKDILSSEEIQKLANTACSNIEVKKAFLFSCLTGLRFIDIKALKWQNIDKGNQSLTILQTKTNKKLTIRLHSSAMTILDGIEMNGETVFTLPSHTGCLKSLKTWLKKAEIQKHITWHCARHSFGTNLIFYGADVNTASNLLGHTSLKHTQRYTHVVKSLKERAIDNLPAINI